MAFSFSNEPSSPPADPKSTAEDSQAQPSQAPAESPAVARFNSCRWQQPIEDGIPAFCTHREVKPYAGTTGFDAEAWCGDCQYYKLRRVPKKRSRDDYAY